VTERWVSWTTGDVAFDIVTFVVTDSSRNILFWGEAPERYPNRVLVDLDMDLSLPDRDIVDEALEKDELDWWCWWGGRSWLVEEWEVAWPKPLNPPLGEP
jgi:hypothetical protein